MLAFPALPPAPTVYRGEHLDRIAFPLGGIGAGSVCLSGTGALHGWSIRNRPDLFAYLPMFAMLAVDGHPERVLEGPVPSWRMHHPWGRDFKGTGTGGEDHGHGLRRCRSASFTARFPFAEIDLGHPGWPIDVRMTAWSPFIPSQANDSSLPVAVLEYTVSNNGVERLHGRFSFLSRNLLHPQGQDCSVEGRDDGFVLRHTPAGHPWERVAVRVACAQAAWVDTAWLGGSWSALRVIPGEGMRARSGRDAARPDGRSPGASFGLALDLSPGEAVTVRVLIAWHAPDSEQRFGHDVEPCPDAAARHHRGGHRPWYAGRYADVDAVVEGVQPRLDDLRRRSSLFRDALHATTLPAPLIDAVTANLGILRSPTVLRQTDGRLWAWEGSQDAQGSCHGSCTHVWNYAQALPHLFPSLERTLRETEFLVNQDAAGHQTFRASLPIRTPDHGYHAAVDGQCGGLMKLHRDWRIAGDDAWLRRLWPAAKTSYAWCVEAWDPDHDGVMDRPRHNTYDIEFSGSDPLSQGFYAGACAAMAEMAAALGEDPAPYVEAGRKAAAGLAACWNGSWLVQRRPDPRGWQPRPGGPEFPLRHDPVLGPVIAEEGPLYQIGDGVLTDATTGIWIAEACGLGTACDRGMVDAQIAAVCTHNVRSSLQDHENAQRGDYAFGDDGGLLVASWPAGGRPLLSFPYSDEVWTSQEYAIACQLLRQGKADEAVRIVAAARNRHDGKRRNPFDDQECGHWYARALASYDLLRAASGVRYDARYGVLHVAPAMSGDFTTFLAWDGGYGTVSVRAGQVEIRAVEGELHPRRIAFVPFSATPIA
jgi:hypothetical protein